MFSYRRQSLPGGNTTNTLFELLEPTLQLTRKFLRIFVQDARRRRSSKELSSEFEPLPLGKSESLGKKSGLLHETSMR